MYLPQSEGDIFSSIRQHTWFYCLRMTVSKVKAPTNYMYVVVHIIDLNNTALTFCLRLECWWWIYTGSWFAESDGWLSAKEPQDGAGYNMSKLCRRLRLKPLNNNWEVYSRFVSWKWVLSWMYSSLLKFCHGELSIFGLDLDMVVS